MKHLHNIILILFLTTTYQLNSQNLLPFNWELKLEGHGKTSETKNVNLLLSWERQEISYLTEPGILSTKFSVPKIFEPSDFVLEISLRLNIHDIYINGQRIGGNIENQFIWSANPNYKTNKFSISSKILKIGDQNEIKILCSNYSYTGGISNNSVRLYPVSNSMNSEFSISIPSKDHLFTSSRSVSFNLDCFSRVNGYVDITLKNDFSDTILTKQIPIKKGKHQFHVDLGNENLEPGFYEIIAILNNGYYLGDVEWFTISPTELIDTNIQSKHFNEFWAKALSELSKVEPNYKIVKVDSLCTEKRDGFIVEMTSIDDTIIKAYYFVPKNKLNRPAILNLPGYGYGFEYLDEFLKVEDEVIEMALCVRGHGLSRDSFVPDTGTGFMGHRIYDKEECAYRKIYLDCIRAIDFLLSRPEVNKEKIGVFGGSQGGGLAVMTAGLVPNNVSALAYFNPFPCDIRTTINIRTMIKQEIKGFLNVYDNKYSLEDALNTFDYLDTKHFASKISAQCLYLTGLFDDDCPPRQGFSAYNKIESPKRFKIFPNDSHIGESGYKKYAMDFFKEVFKY